MNLENINQKIELTIEVNLNENLLNTIWTKFRLQDY